jgi:hypothetical protein
VYKYSPKKKVLKYYTIMYVKNLIKWTLENLRHTVGKVPQKEVRRKRRRRRRTRKVHQDTS